MTPEDELLEAVDRIRNLIPPHDPEEWSNINFDTNIRHIRYKGDHSGYNHPLRRLWRGLKHAFWTGDKFSRILGIKWSLGHAIASLRVHVPADHHRPDAVLYGGSIICFWAEHAGHVALWSPPIAEAVADWLDKATPEDESALKLAKLINGVVF